MIKRALAIRHLMDLLKVPGPSGGEAAVAALVIEKLIKCGCKKSWLRHDDAHKKIGDGYEVGNLIVKLPGSDARNRAVVESGQGYEREVRFFCEFAADCSLATSRCYLALMDPDPREFQRERDRALEAIDVATRSALDEVAQRGTEIAVDLAGRIISKELDAADHASLIRDSIDQFASNN